MFIINTRLNMVKNFESDYEYKHDFKTSTLAHINRYPNPYSKHVLSSDTLDKFIDENGCLFITRVFVKKGRLPQFIVPFLGTTLNSWIIEKIMINPSSKTMYSYTSNIDFRKFIRIEEHLKFTKKESHTYVQGKVKFTSNFIGFSRRIELWCHNKFSSNLKNSRKGVTHVMNTFKCKNLI